MATSYRGLSPVSSHPLAPNPAVRCISATSARNDNSERHAGSAVDAHDALLGKAQLVGGANCLDLALAVGAALIPYEQHARLLLGQLAGLTLPLPISTQNRETGGKARRDFGIEEGR